MNEYSLSLSLFSSAAFHLVLLRNLLISHESGDKTRKTNIVLNNFQSSRSTRFGCTALRDGINGAMRFAFIFRSRAPFESTVRLCDAIDTEQLCHDHRVSFGCSVPFLHANVCLGRLRSDIPDQLVFVACNSRASTEPKQEPKQKIFGSSNRTIINSIRNANTKRDTESNRLLNF